MEQHLSEIKQAYTAILFEMSEQGFGGPRHRDTAYALSAQLASRLTGDEISPDKVRLAVRVRDA